MNRITIHGESGERLGYFDLDAAAHVLKEDTEWNGNDYLGKVSGLQTTRADLYRTSGGRWVEHHNASREFNGPDRWSFLTDDEARDWIIKSGGPEAEKALAEHFPETPEESGPPVNPQGGRPSIGPTVNTAYPRELLDRIDAAAKTAGLTRAAWLRQVAAAAVGDAEARVPVDL